MEKKTKIILASGIVALISILLGVMIGAAIYVYDKDKNEKDAKKAQDQLIEEAKDNDISRALEELDDEDDEDDTAPVIERKEPNDDFLNPKRERELKEIADIFAEYLADGNDLSSIGVIKSCTTGSTSIGTEGFDFWSDETAADYFENPIENIPYGTEEETGYSVCQNANGTYTFSVTDDESISFTK